MPCATQVISAMWSWMETPPRMWKPLKPWCAGCMTAALATAASTTRWTGTRFAAMWASIGDVCPRCGRKEGEAIPPERIAELKKMYPEMPAFQGIE